MAKRALIVGINDYEGTQNDLPSCVEDTKQFENLLRGSPYGFTDVTVYRDSQATVANVEYGLKQLFEGAKPDDVLVFFYSGHGYSSPKNDVLQEYLVLYDDLFQDDRLSELSQVLPDGVLFTVVLDSCFSGGLEKRLFSLVDGERAKVKAWRPSDTEEARDLEAEKSIKGFKAFGAPVIDVPSITRTKEFREEVQSDETRDIQFKGLLLAACLETETAAASTSQTKGMSAFTYCFLDALATKGTDAPISAVIEATLERLRLLNFGQTPVIKYPKASAGLESVPFLSARSGQAPPASGIASPTDEDDLRRLATIIAILMAVEDKAFRFPTNPASLNCTRPRLFDDGPPPFIADLMKVMRNQSPPTKSDQGTKNGDSTMTEKRWTDYLEPALAILGALNKGGAQGSQDEPAADGKRWTDFIGPAVAILGALNKGENGAQKFRIGGGFSSPLGGGGFEISSKEFQAELEPIVLLAQKLAEVDGGGDKGWLRDAGRSINREVRRGASSIKPEDVVAAARIAMLFA